MTLPYRLLNLFVWLRRCGYSRGFGVQSPWAYRFIRYVINEHYLYYEYGRLAKEIKGVDPLVRKLCRLYFRISNYCLSDIFLDYEPETGAYAEYVKAGHKQTQVFTVKNDDAVATLQRLKDDITIGLVRMAISGDYRSFANAVLDAVSENSVIVVEGINANKDAKRFWKDIQNDSRSGVTFDLYYCGIVTFDHQLYKQHYIVNF